MRGAAAILNPHPLGGCRRLRAFTVEGGGGSLPLNEITTNP